MCRADSAPASRRRYRGCRAVQPLPPVVVAGRRRGSSGADDHFPVAAGGADRQPLAGAGPARQARPAAAQRIVPDLRRLFRRLPPPPRRTLQPHLLHCPAAVPGHGQLHRFVARTRGHVGCHGGHDARHRAARLLQPHAAIHRSHLEVPSRRLGWDRAGPARLLFPCLRRLAAGHGAIASTGPAPP